MEASHDVTQVVTLELDPERFAWLNALRRQHFPAALNYLDAHLTLFYKVNEDDVVAIARVAAERHTDAITLNFNRLRNLGRGVAVEVDAPALVTLREDLSRALAGSLTRQDRQPFRPHVTIQNKADPAAARDLLRDLSDTFTPSAGTGVAVLIWDYLGGPWRLRERLPF